jgi:hypothetical protein
MAASGRPGYAFLQCGRGEALVTAGPGRQKAAGRRLGAAGAEHREALRMVALTAGVHLLRSRRFYQRVISAAIALLLGVMRG